LPIGQKPYTITMPNTWNVAFDFEFFAGYGMPIVYLMAFPPMYMYMLA
jgi:hypothetical protein